MEEFISQEDMPLNEGISDSTIQEFNNLDLSNEKDKQIAELSKRGYQLLKENNFEGAKESFQSILIQDENNNYALVGLGDTMRKENDIQQAVVYYNKCLESYPANNYALFGLADCYKAMNQYKKAIDIWQKYLLQDE